MENVIHKLTLDLTGPDMLPRIEVQQDNARTLVISLTQGGRPYWIAEGVTAVFSGRKPDGNPLFNACAIEKNRVRYDFTDQTTNVAGIVECEILLYSGDERILASPRFELAIDELIHKEGDVPESAPELSALTQMVAAGTAMIEDLRAALGELENVEEMLVQAQDAADAARQSATQAQESQTAAETARSRAVSASNGAQLNAQKAQKQAEAAAVSAEQAADARSAAFDAMNFAEQARDDSQAAQAGAEQAAGAAHDAAGRAEAAAERAEKAQENGITRESDPTVPDWAKQPNKPSYTAEEVGADPVGTASMCISGHNAARYAHEDIRIELQALSDRVSLVLNSDDVTLDQLSEIVDYIKSNKTLIDAITTSKISVGDIVNDLVTNVANRPLSAAQGVALKALIDGLSSGKLDADRLPDAVSAALAQAKESGEFDGPTGAPGAPGDDYVLTDADRQEIAEIAADIVQASDREELPITDMAGYKIAPTGTVLTGDAATQLVSAPIPINGGDTLLVTGSAKFGNSLWAIYDAAGGMLRNEAAPATAEGAAVEAVEVGVPVGAATIRVAWDTGVSTIPYAVARADGQGQSGAALPLAGVTVAIIGDSIVEHNATADTNWVDIVAAATGASITNLGVGGTGWMQGQEDGTAYYQRVADIPADTRRVLIYGSGNDRELPLGTPADTGTDTLCGCINATLDAVYAHVPTAWVGVISPAPWQHYPPYERGNAMDLMAQAQAAICRRRGVPFLDLYHSSGLRPWDAAFRELAYHDADGVHPNNTGHGLIAPQMLAFLLGGTHNPVDAQEIAEIAAGMVEVPEGGGGSAKWKRIGIFTAADNINPWIINADEDGNKFSCTEFRIRAKLCWFQLATNSTNNREIAFYGDDGSWYPISLSNLPGGFAAVVKGENASEAAATFKHPAVIDVTTHGGLLVAETIGESTNNEPSVLIGGVYRNRGVQHGAARFSQLRIKLGYPTNLVMAGSTVEIWGR